MLERRHLWQKIRRILHSPKQGRVAWKVEDTYKAGLPDILGGSSISGAYLMETKVSRTANRITINLTPGQLNHLLEWRQGGGVSYVFVWDEIKDHWYLFRVQELPVKEPTPWKLNHEDARARSIASGTDATLDTLLLAAMVTENANPAR